MRKVFDCWKISYWSLLMFFCISMVGIDSASACRIKPSRLDIWRENQEDKREQLDAIRRLADSADLVIAGRLISKRGVSEDEFLGEFQLDKHSKFDSMSNPLHIGWKEQEEFVVLCGGNGHAYTMEVVSMTPNQRYLIYLKNNHVLRARPMKSINGMVSQFKERRLAQKTRNLRPQ